jgi:hypothetical protein
MKNADQFKMYLKNIETESVFLVSSAKPKKEFLEMADGVPSMALVAFMTPEHNGLVLDARQRAEVFVSALFVLLIQVALIGCVWNYMLVDESF